MSSVAQFWEEQFNDDSNNPFDGVQVYHYEAGTTSTKNVWLDRAKTTVAEQPHRGDSHGFVWFYGDGLYRLRILDKDNNLLYDWDNVGISPDNVGIDAGDCEVGMVPVYVGPDNEFECDFVDLANVRGCLPIENCGTGTDDVPEAGSLLIGNLSGGYNVARLVEGDGIEITNGDGTITISTSSSGSPFSSTGQRSSVVSDTTFNLVADQIILRANTSANFLIDLPATQTNTVTISGPAVNGRDKSSTFSDNSWVHFYWIYDLGDDEADPVRAPTLASISSAAPPPTGPTLPTNYTHWCYAGAVRWTGSQLKGTHINGSEAFYDERQEVFSTGAFVISEATDVALNTAETAVDVSATVPPNALTIFADLGLLAHNIGARVQALSIRTVSGKDYVRATHISGHGAGTGFIDLHIDIPNLSQRYYYKIDLAGEDHGFQIHTRGYRLPNNGG